MTVLNNNLVQIDLPMWEILSPLPVTAVAGAIAISDPRGTHRFIYYFAAYNIWRYDTYSNTWQQLVSAPSGAVIGAGTCACFDPSRGSGGYVWLLTGTTATWFGYYDIAANTWTAKSVTGLPATFATDGDLSHPCTGYNGGGDDDSIFLIGNAATTFYKYSITGNSWVSNLATVTAAPGAGCQLWYLPVYDPAKLVCVRGSASIAMYAYALSNSWAGITYVPNTESFTTGTVGCPRMTADQLFIQKDVTGRIYLLDIGDGTLTPVATLPISHGTAYVGNRMVYIKTTDGIEFLYIPTSNGTTWMRTALMV